MGPRQRGRVGSAKESVKEKQNGLSFRKPQRMGVKSTELGAGWA